MTLPLQHDADHDARHDDGREDPAAWEGGGAFAQLDRGGGTAAVGEDFLRSMNAAEAHGESGVFGPKNRGSHGARDALCGSGNTWRQPVPWAPLCFNAALIMQSKIKGKVTWPDQLLSDPTCSSHHSFLYK
jgi:hypothetical protein